MGFTFSLVYNDVWYKEDTRLSGTKYYAHILVYVDDVLIVVHTLKTFILFLQKAYYDKESSIGPPSIYLGSQIKQVTDRSGKQA